MALSRLIWSGSELGVGAKSAPRAALAVTSETEVIADGSPRISVQVESRILTLNSPGATAGYISTRGCSW